MVLLVWPSSVELLLLLLVPSSVSVLLLVVKSESLSSVVSVTRCCACVIPTNSWHRHTRLVMGVRIRMLSDSDKFLQIRNPTGFQTDSRWIRIRLSFWKAFFDDSSQFADGWCIRRELFSQLFALILLIVQFLFNQVYFTRLCQVGFVTRENFGDNWNVFYGPSQRDWSLKGFTDSQCQLYC